MTSLKQKIDIICSALSQKTPAAVTDERLRVIAAGSQVFKGGIILADGFGGYQLLSRDNAYPLCRTELDLDGKSFYLFTVISENDMPVLLGRPVYERVCRIYSGRLRTGTADYLSIIPQEEEEEGSLPFDISQKIKLANLYLLSGFANCELMTHLSSARLAVTYDLSDELFDYTENLKAISKANSFSFTSNISSSVVTDIDPALIRCIISNLLVNSFAYNKGKDKRAELSLSTAQGRIKITVTDNAGGISEGDIKHTFTPFYDYGSGGEGLGLYIARLFAVSHGGSLALDNKDGGLCAELTLSARRESAVPVSAPTAPYYTTLLEPEYVILAKAMKILI